MPKKEKKPLVPGWPLPETDETTIEQEMLITELLNKVVKNPPEDQPPPQYLLNMDEVDLRVSSYKFLVARKWKVDKAEKMWRDAIAFKAKYKCYDIPYFPSPYPTRGYDAEKLNEVLGLEPCPAGGDLERIQQGVAHTYEAVFHKWDKMNHPIWIERTGRIRVRHFVRAFKALAAIGEAPEEVCVRYQTHFNEIGVRLAQYNDRVLGKPAGRRVLGVTVVMDMTSFGYHTLYNPILQLLKKCWAVDEDIYPEGVHKLFIVNTPTMITFAWNIVKGWLDARTRGKVQFLKPDVTTEALLEVIDAENLPEFLGGRCICEEYGGCCDQRDEASPGSPLYESEAMLTEEIKLDSRKKGVREFTLVIGDEVAWEWEITDGELPFSVKYIPHDGSEPEDVVPAEKVRTHSGSYTAENANGRLLFMWDNSGSWIKSKTLRLRAFKVAVDTEAASPTTESESSPPKFQPEEIPAKEEAIAVTSGEE